MKLVKCRKCGTAVMTDDSLLENMVEEMSELNRKAMKARNGADKQTYNQQASQLKKMISQIQHRTTEMETRIASNETQLARLKKYVIDNKLMTYEQLDEIRDAAALEAEQKNKKDSEYIEKIYGAYRNDMVNRTNKDGTAKDAIKNL